MYEYRRNLQTSKKLYEQYRLRLVESPVHVILLTLRITMKDWNYVLRHERRVGQLLKTLLSVPFLNLATLYGQYVGLKAAEANLAIEKNPQEMAS